MNNNNSSSSNSSSSLMEKRTPRRNNNNTSPSTSPVKRASFSEAVVAKTDVGDFQEGYFIMSTHDELKMKKPALNNSSSRASPQRRRPIQQTYGTPNSNNTNQRDETSLKTLKQSSPKQQQQQQQQMHKVPIQLLQSSPSSLIAPQVTPQTEMDDEFLLTPATISKISDAAPSIDSSTPKKNKPAFSHQQSTPTQSMGKMNASLPTRGSDSPKRVSSPQSSCWAGGAFNNSPPPSSLPLPNFEDFQNQHQTVPDLQSMTFDLRRLLNITPTVSCSEY
ncbi:hypothetical protein SAMD00019534_012460 [Acytostelium subglobosum LB1]|uniref:hypothetical protein n=1 Tax=Acytostelium subglobosum LB1 TaxID=1410327 RepID=UPI000644E3EE|nr:hypothetical protein SAMD00019534_012460 [Acytostelium subglobosum LB1]GAM18071.1 hypothetical protein SAMD00019534_012460 [Acytostelium subglobosum LB1]|eukprot:XP_012758667.1 hypothetical protein SAMD00019534_012460 [Acytostelium subglobosum LB1]